MTAVISPETIRDLAEIHAFIARDRPRAADRVLDRLAALFTRLASGELQGGQVQLVDGRRVQAWPMPPYRIYYTRTATETFILRVYHQARRPIER